MNTDFTYQLGKTLKINRLGYGSMQLTGPGVWGDTPRRELAKRVLETAFELGINFFDTADSYGPYTNEVLIQEALQPYYSDIVITTKGGFERTGPNQWVLNGHPGHIREAIDGSLRRLKKDTIDLWQLHRVDPAIPLEDTLEPVAKAIQEGKIRFVGLSEVAINDIELAQKIVPIVSVQNLYNIENRKWEDVLEYTTAHHVAFIPWYPLGPGPEILQHKIGAIAVRHNATLAQVAIAWLLRRAENILLVPGTHSPEQLREIVQGKDILLSQEEFDYISALHSTGNSAVP